MKTKIKCSEKSRKIISTEGATLSLHNVTSFDSGSGDFLRFDSDEGYVIVNNDNVFAHVINFDKTQRRVR